MLLDALNFFGISNEINYIVEDNKLKHNKFLPGVKIPIVSKKKIEGKKFPIVVLAWNYFNEIKKNNIKLKGKFINIKDLEKNFLKLFNLSSCFLRNHKIMVLGL